MSLQVAPINGTHIHYSQSGPKDAPVLVFSNSLGTDLRIWDDDVRLILDGMADATLAGAYVLFPDPWPKRRHAARRILQPLVLNSLARLIRPGGSLVLASDHPVAKAGCCRRPAAILISSGQRAVRVTGAPALTSWCRRAI